MAGETDAGEAVAGELAESRILLLAVAAAIVTANAYYIHPIIARVAETFGVSDSLVGAVPAFNQFALAIGIFFLLPLGDRFSNRKLITIFLVAQILALVLMAFAENFWLFVGASTALGFFTITPYILPAYASRRVSASRLAHVTAVANGIGCGWRIPWLALHIFHRGCPDARCQLCAQVFAR